MINKIFNKIKFLIKYLIFLFKFKLNRINTEDYQLEKIKYVKNPIKKKNNLIKFSKIYPKNPFVEFALYENSLELAEFDSIKYLEKYYNKYKEWLKLSGLNSLNMEFVNEAAVVGSLGNSQGLYQLIEANKYKLRPQKKIFMLLRSKLRNKALFEYFREHLNVIRDKEEIKNLLPLQEKLEIPLGQALDFHDRILRADNAWNLIESFKIKNKINNNTFNIMDKHKEFGEKKLKEIGIPNNSWYVTLHARELGYRGETKRNTTQNFRTVDIHNYLPAIKSILDAGGFVFRMGHKTNLKLPKIDGVIDYANSNFKSDVMDVFLGATSSFSIGTSSGYHIIPKMFNVPILLADCPSYHGYFYLNEKDLFLPRLFHSEKDKNFMKFKDVFLPPYKNFYLDEQFKKSRIQAVHNTPDDLKDATVEMIEKKNNGFKINFSDQNQIRFKNLIQNIYSTDKKNSYVPMANMSTNFLNKNKNLL